MTNNQKILGFNNIGRFLVTHDDLPISCPMQNQPLWNGHPRVYLPILKTGKATCPYCSAHYVLKDTGRDNIEGYC